MCVSWKSSGVIAVSAFLGVDAAMAPPSVETPQMSSTVVSIADCFLESTLHFGNKTNVCLYMI